MVELLQLTKTYPNGVVALHDLSLRIDQGEFVFLMGQSGAGKSTLIRMLIREEWPTSGQIFVNSRNLVRMKKKEIPLLRRSVGMVFQDFRLLESRTVEENISFAMMVVGAPPREIRRRVKTVIHEVGLDGKENSFPNELSGGEQQRVGIARAIINRPMLIIADEPTGNLDQRTSEEIMELLYAINREGTTVIMATHAQELVRNAKRRVVVLDRGKIVADMPPGAYLG